LKRGFTSLLGGILRISWLLVLLAFLPSCRSGKESSKLLLAEALEISETEMPAVVELLDQQGRTQCTGTFVGPNAILTAAHCLQRRFGSAVRTPLVYLNQNDDFETIVQISSQGQESGFGDDLAILILETDVAPASIKMNASGIASGTIMSLIGYGCTGGSVGAGHKRKGKAKILDIKDDNRRSKSVIISTVTPRYPNQTQLPIQDRQAHLCPGDSGGPALIDGAVAGVASWLDPSDSRGYVNRWASVSSEFAKSIFATSVAEGAKIENVHPNADPSQVRIERFKTGREERKAARAGAMQAKRRLRTDNQAGIEDRNRRQIESGL